MATLQWLEPYRSYCDSPALPTVTAPRIPKLRRPCWTRLMFPVGGSWGWSRLPQHKGQSLIFVLFIDLLGDSLCRGFEYRAVSWVCFPTLPWNSCFAGKLGKSVVPELCLVFAVLQASSMSVCLWGFGAHFYLPFERASSPLPILMGGDGRSSDSPFSPMETFVRKIHTYVPHSEYPF